MMFNSYLLTKFTVKKKKKTQSTFKKADAADSLKTLFGVDFLESSKATVDYLSDVFFWSASNTLQVVCNKKN